MQKIDWTKPLRQMGGMAKIIDGLEYLGPLKGSFEHIVRIYPVSEYDTGAPELVRYHDYGQCLTNGRTAYTLENVPEEPKDHILLFRNSGEDTWRVDVAGVNTKSAWREVIWQVGTAYRDTLIVKVPV